MRADELDQEGAEGEPVEVHGVLAVERGRESTMGCVGVLDTFGLDEMAGRFARFKHFSGPNDRHLASGPNIDGGLELYQSRAHCCNAYIAYVMGLRSHLRFHRRTRIADGTIVRNKAMLEEVEASDRRFSDQRATVDRLGRAKFLARNSEL